MRFISGFSSHTPPRKSQGWGLALFLIHPGGTGSFPDALMHQGWIRSFHLRRSLFSHIYLRPRYLLLSFQLPQESLEGIFPLLLFPLLKKNNRWEIWVPPAKLPRTHFFLKKNYSLCHQSCEIAFKVSVNSVLLVFMKIRSIFCFMKGQKSSCQL